MQPNGYVKHLRKRTNLQWLAEAPSWQLENCKRVTHVVCAQLSHTTRSDALVLQMLTIHTGNSVSEFHLWVQISQRFKLRISPSECLGQSNLCYGSALCMITAAVRSAESKRICAAASLPAGGIASVAMPTENYQISTRLARTPHDECCELPAVPS